jgi:hypothetical protein
MIDVDYYQLLNFYLIEVNMFPCVPYSIPGPRDVCFCGCTSCSRVPEQTLQNVPQVIMDSIIGFCPSLDFVRTLGEVSKKCAGLVGAFLQNNLRAITNRCDQEAGFRTLPGGIVARSLDYDLCRQIADRIPRGNPVIFHARLAALIREHFNDCPGGEILPPGKVFEYARLKMENRSLSPTAKENGSLSPTAIGLLESSNALNGRNGRRPRVRGFPFPLGSG